LAKLVLPFVRPPTNLLKFAGERSPLALLHPGILKTIKAGGAARDEALARITMGSGLSARLRSTRWEGRISGGGPSDPQEAAALKNAGWQPYSVRVGDKWRLTVALSAEHHELRSSGPQNRPRPS
jgi:hypothetical protein